MDASEWIYLAEGGKHVVFGYHGNNQTYDCRVLRVVKSFFHVACARGPTGDMEVEPPTRSASTVFLEKVIQPLLGPSYSDLPDTVAVTRDFMRQLYQQTIDSGAIPEKRMANWQIPNDQDDQKPIPPIFFITMLKDNSKIKSQMANKPLSVEIKPKAGFVTCSPLVKPKHRIRLKHTKFEIKQQRMKRGSIIAPWIDSGDAEHEKTRSFYDPVDLFSRQKDRVERSLGELTAYMANNLRFWYEGEMIFGYSSDGPNNQVSNDVINNIFPTLRDTISSDDIHDLHEFILDTTKPIVSNILVHDVFLDNLKRAQHLDVISDDGAEEIYKHFVSFFDGSMDDAEAFLDQYVVNFESTAPSQTSSVPAIFAHSPYQFPMESSAITALCDQIESFREFTSYDGCQSQNLLDADIEKLDEAYETAFNLIPQLDKIDCAYLLANWLLSLCTVDISFFVTLQCLNESESQAIGKNSLNVIDVEDEHGKLKYIYTIKVVDCDPKPARSLSHRAFGVAK